MLSITKVGYEYRGNEFFFTTVLRKFTVEVLKCFVNVCIVRLLCDNERIIVFKKLELDQPMKGILNKQNQPMIVTVARPNDQ